MRCKHAFLTIFGLAVAVASTEVFAQQSCTEIGCVNGLMLKVDPAYDWKAGLYDFQFSLDGRQVKCSGSLPLKSCEDGPSLRCDKDGVQITESGCAMPASQQSFGDILIKGEPRTVLVRITRFNLPVVTRTITPQYQRFLPNGPGCGPICHSATYDLFSAK